MEIHTRHWLGEKVPRFTLLLTVDDATGTVPGAMFSKEEDTRSYFLLMSSLIRRYGIPLALYSDRHPVFKFTGDLSQYPAGPTQFARAMEELGIRQIYARSPQAKGRVERAAATFQDRLGTELRLSGAATIDEANEVLNSFLSRFNEKFSVQAEESKPAYCPLDPALTLEHILCFKHSRKAARDNTVKYNKRTLQLLPGRDLPSYAGLQVEVLEDLEDRISVQYLGQTINTQEAPPRPGLLRAVAAARAQVSGESQRGVAVNGRWQESLATLETGEVDRPRRTRKSRVKQDRKPTPRQRTIWQAVQEAKLRGLSLRAIARELGIHRGTAKRYALAESPPMRRTTIATKGQRPNCAVAA